MNYTTYIVALANFLKLLTEREQKHKEENFKNLKPCTFEVHEGRKYDKIVRVDSQHSTVCFIHKTTGDIFKGNWKSVEKPVVERGNIFGADPLKGTGIYGTDCLR